MLAPLWEKQFQHYIPTLTKSIPGTFCHQKLNVYTSRCTDSIIINLLQRRWCLRLRRYLSVRVGIGIPIFLIWIKALGEVIQNIGFQNWILQEVLIKKKEKQKPTTLGVFLSASGSFPSPEPHVPSLFSATGAIFYWWYNFIDIEFLPVPRV